MIDADRVSGFIFDPELSADAGAGSAGCADVRMLRSKRIRLNFGAEESR